MYFLWFRLLYVAQSEVDGAVFSDDSDHNEFDTLDAATANANQYAEMNGSDDDDLLDKKEGGSGEKDKKGSGDHDHLDDDDEYDDDEYDESDSDLLDGLEDDSDEISSARGLELADDGDDHMVKMFNQAVGDGTRWIEY